GEQTAFFESKIRPLLAERCYSCHGPRVRQAGLRLDSRAELLKGADTGIVAIPGDPDRSRLIRSVRYQDKLRMPPTGRLRADEISALEEWVRQGMPWPLERMKVEGGRMKGEHWAFRPVTRPAVPAVKNTGWVKNPIDAFVLAGLEKRGLKPAPPADPLTLIRRVTYDLTGLPPTPEEVDAFLRECEGERAGPSGPGERERPNPVTGSPAVLLPAGKASRGTVFPNTEHRTPNTPVRAYTRLVDRLLASPQYGERWGRRWLDVVRYADTAGETADYPVPQAYRYRNYVIDAFNRDKPYNRFLQEQIAGDLLAASGSPEAYAEAVTATGFLAISRRFGFDSENYHHLTIEDTLDTLGKSMLGLTVGCARCHDHKFDPVPAADYYGLYGIFAGTRYPFPGSEEKKRPRDFAPLVPPAEATRRQQAFDAELAGLTGEVQRLQGERDGLRARIGRDGDFEFQAEGEVPGLPWINGPNSQAKVRAAAQSPFTHLFPAGRVGVSFLNDAAYSGFGQPVAPGWTPATGDRLYYNADFRNTGVQAGGSGSLRYYVGHGPGVSAAVELFVDGDRFYVRNGGQIEPVRELKVGQWYNVQLMLDLKARTFSGTVGTPGDLTAISPRSFHPGWDGTIDYFFVDSYGHQGGVRPGHDVDQLSLGAMPLPAPSLTRGEGVPARGPANVALRSRIAEVEQQLASLERRRAERMEQGPYEVAYAVAEGTPQNAHIQLRGDPRTPGAEVPRHFLTVLGGATLPPATPGSGRLALAQWITEPKNPLTARVWVNRVWQGHFGRALVRTPNDFGTRGTPPTHPELLDYLAGVFVSGDFPAGETSKSKSRTGAAMDQNTGSLPKPNTEHRTPSSLRTPNTEHQRCSVFG
ncbi:MAG: Protein of unknown function (DUF1553)/Protein of unknown function (DUF1549)/Planctomycete, partial [Armatimonadetes bacterium]|nr:Protein of unknown function (DUF1553)/Protein of unknown function (DUF1549)/Planctomycete [Armatimonadota bacterium]